MNQGGKITKGPSQQGRKLWAGTSNHSDNSLTMKRQVLVCRAKFPLQEERKPRNGDREGYSSRF
jgi:hypothetical protein